MIIRSIREEEVPGYIALKGRAYGYAATPVGIANWMKKTDLARALGLFISGELVAAASSYSLQLVIPNGERIAVSGVAGVAVPPENRGQGYFRALVEAQLSQFETEGDGASVLYSTDPALYGRFGFSEITQTVRVDFDLPKSLSAQESPVEVIEATGLYLGAAFTALSDQPGEVLPSQELWSASVKTGTQSFQWSNTAGDVEAWLTFGIADGIAEIDYLFAKNEKCLQDVFGFLAQLSIPRYQLKNASPEQRQFVEALGENVTVVSKDGLWIKTLDKSLEALANQAGWPQTPHCSLIF